MSEEKITVKTRQQIADEHGINRKTLYRWLKNVGITLDKGLITPKEQELIFKTFGHPEKRKDKKR